MTLDDIDYMPSEQELAAKVTYAEGQLNAGGDNAYMKKWYFEYKGHKEQLQKLRAAKQEALETQGKTILQEVDKAPQTSSHGSGDNSSSST